MTFEEHWKKNNITYDTMKKQNEATWNAATKESEKENAQLKMGWIKAKWPFPEATEVEIAFWDGTLMCRTFGCYDHKESAWYVNGQIFEECGIKVTHWQEARTLPLKDK